MLTGSGMIRALLQKAARLLVLITAVQCCPARFFGWATDTVRITNRSKVPAFFLRAEIVAGADGDEILPITWDDNYVTMFAGESKTMKARYRVDNAIGSAHVLGLQGHNVAAKVEAPRVP